MGMIARKKTIGFKIEATPYTEETLTADNYNLLAYNISAKPDVPMQARAYSDNTFSKYPSVAGKRQAPISFTVDIQWSGTNATPPKYFECLRACGLKQIIYANGVELITDSKYTNVPATIHIVEFKEGLEPVQTVERYCGCMGNAKLIAEDVGTTAKIEFEFKGAFVGIEDRSFANLITPTGFDTPTPDSLLGGTFTLFGQAPKRSKVSIDIGNVVEMHTDISSSTGFEGAHVVDRNPVMEFDADLDTIADVPHYTRWISATTGALVFNVGNHITVSAPAGQIIKAYEVSDREGHSVHPITVEFKRGTSVGNDEFSILQGTRS